MQKKDGTISKQGQGGGQPRKWSSPEDLENFIDEYYEWAKDNDYRVSVTGLAWWLNCSRQTLINYENANDNDWLKGCSPEEKQKYVDTIKKAKRFIEMNYENSLFNKGEATGAIFTLKNNYGWVDKQEIVQTSNVKESLSETEIDEQLKTLGYE